MNFYIAAVQLEWHGETELTVCYVCADRISETTEMIGRQMCEKWPGCDIQKMTVALVERKVLMEVVGKDLARTMRTMVRYQ